MAEKKTKKISTKLIEKIDSALSSTLSSSTNTTEIEELENTISTKSMEEATETSPIDSDYYEKLLEESNSKFLEVSEKLHALESENSKLVSENQELKNRCSELETEKTNLENEVFNSNILVSEKLEIISKLETKLNSFQNNPEGYNINGFVPKMTPTIKGMNGYESWN